MARCSCCSPSCSCCSLVWPLWALFVLQACLSPWATAATRISGVAAPPLLPAAAAAAAAASRVSVHAPDDVVFSSGTVPTDTSGQPVFAHEGWLLNNENAYLWYGTSQKQNVSVDTSWAWLSDSVLLYTSHDLSAWKRRATVFSAGDLPNTVRLRLGGGSSNGLVRLERPKVLYNAGRRYYVLLMALSSLDRSRSELGYAVSVSPYGPFKFDGSSRPDGLPSWALTVASEGDSDAWLARSVPGSGIVISKLNADYLDTTGRCATVAVGQPTAASPQQQQQQQGLRHNWQWQQQQQQQGAHLAATTAAAVQAAVRGSLRSGLHAAAGVLCSIRGWASSSLSAAASAPALAAGSRQYNGVAGAPCLFKFRGKWYLLAAQQAGWAPTKMVLFVNDGSSPCDESSWRQLPSPAQGAGGHHSFDSTPAFVYPHTFEGSDQVLLVYFGDRWDAASPQGPAGASYVWLPLVASSAPGSDPDSLTLLNLDSWRLGDFSATGAAQQWSLTLPQPHAQVQIT